MTATIIAADGTAVVWRDRGAGPPLVLCNGITTSDFFWRRMLPRWQTRHRVITWDYKGHGESAPARSLEGTTIAALADDLRRVLDAAAIESAPIVGFSMGSQVMLELWRAAPERVRAMVSLLGPAGRLFDTALPPFGPILQRLLTAVPNPGVHVAMRGLGTAMYTPGAALLVRVLGYTGHVPERDIAAFRAHFGRLHPPTVAAIARAAGEHDARDLLPDIDVPLLVIAGDRDRFAPAASVGVPFAASAPNAELLRLPSATHTALFEQPMELALAIDEFFARHQV
ncbi:MAG: alpha/beta hydrolase [Deltaproteobacteria bacterium]|nr:alpha/beta hydrolase [Nannocystaceae bacterium]